LTASKRRAEEYEFNSPEVNACPYAFYEAAREECPVYPLPGQSAFLLTRFDDVYEAAHHPETFSSHRPILGSGDPEFEAIRATGYPEVPTLVTNDPPEHSRYRKLVNRAFSIRAVAALEPSMTAIVDEVIDGFIDRGDVEFLTEFAMPFPTRVIGNALGVPVEDHGHFQRWSDAIADAVSTYVTRERALECKRSLVEMQHYFAGLIEKRRVQPGDDLVSQLVTARVEDERPLDVPEMLDLIRIFLAGGNETTASLLATAMFLLLTHPDQFEIVAADRSLIPAMLEEALRLEPPVQWNPRIIERDDAEIRGVTLPAGSRVLLGWGPGNRDPKKYGPDADRFDVRRGTSDHLAFGHGPHFCLGAALARTEARIAFERLFTRMTNIRLAVPADQITYNGAFVRRLNHLPLHFDKAASA
jgi:cytochrome P450